jgi:hypothetical protein
MLGNKDNILQFRLGLRKVSQTNTTMSMYIIWKVNTIKILVLCVGIVTTIKSVPSIIVAKSVPDMSKYIRTLWVTHI